MFTIKYRTFTPSATQCADPGSPTYYDQNEQLHGPFDLVSQEMQDGLIVIYAHNGDDPGTTFGPFRPPETANEEPPRPTLWVMNEAGATVAKYDL